MFIESQLDKSRVRIQQYKHQRSQLLREIDRLDELIANEEETITFLNRGLGSYIEGDSK